MKLETPAEACAALAVLIAGADEVGTMEEGRFMFDTIASQPAFAGMDHGQFKQLMADTTDWIWSSFQVSGGRVTDEGVDKLVGIICGALPTEMRAQALMAAVGLARADGMDSSEELLLSRLCDGLEVDRSVLGDGMA